ALYGRAESEFSRFSPLCSPTGPEIGAALDAPRSFRTVCLIFARNNAPAAEALTRDAPGPSRWDAVGIFQQESERWPRLSQRSSPSRSLGSFTSTCASARRQWAKF